MEEVKVGLVQMRCEKGNIIDNLNSMSSYLKQSKDQSVDIICFPEMNVTGYINPTQYPQAILNIDSAEINRVIEMSGIYDITIISGFVEMNMNGKPFITQIVASDGKLLGFYRKKTIKGEEAKWFSPGCAVSVFSHSKVKFGIAICADIDDAGIFRECAKLGARIVFVSAAPGLYGEQSTRDWETGFNWWKNECMEKLGRYARNNGIYIAVATQAGRTLDEDFPGGGYVFSPEGKCIYATPDWSEGILYANLALD